MAEALRHLLQGEFEVVATVADGRAPLQAADGTAAGPWWSSISSMPLLNGLDAGEQLKLRRSLTSRVIYLGLRTASRAWRWRRRSAARPRATC